MKILEVSEKQFYELEIKDLLFHVYVESGFTEWELADRLFSPLEVKRRGPLIAAFSENNEFLGMVVCGNHKNPFRQVAKSDEAEMQLLAVWSKDRCNGIGEGLCVAFEQKARSMNLTRLALSTQPQMKAAHKLYEKLGYSRNSDRDWNRQEKVFWVYEKQL